jgi:SAM-dependent methyltransferase
MLFATRARRGAHMLRRELLPLVGLNVARRWPAHAADAPSAAREYLRTAGWLLKTGGFTPAELSRLCEFVERGLVQPEVLAASFLRLPPFLRRLHPEPDVNPAHHTARCELVRRELPRARRVLDLGGASDGAPEGALLSMGYPHAPEEVCIVDQPLSERRHYDARVAPTGPVRAGATTVRYVYSSMTDLSGFEDASVDLVWSGQSIEHISEEDGDRVIAEALRVLRPGGAFCLDTPNGPMARLLSPFAPLHPEHHVEYAPSALAAKLTRAGFTVRRRLAVSPMPISRRLQRFSKWELLASPPLGPDADDGYSFYLEGLKPGG